MIVLDTNVVSELMREAAEPAVIAWVRGQASATLAVTAVSVAEVGYGIERLPAGRRRDVLRERSRLVFDAFATAVLDFDEAAATEFGPLVAGRERQGRPIGGLDAQIAAICRANRASLATRDTSDFSDVGIDLVDPWVEGRS